jgi:glutathione S-transferase
MEQWISIETSNFAGHAMKFVYQYVFKREQAAEVLKTAGAALDLAYRTMDEALATKPYLAGEALSLADVCFMPYLEYLSLSPAASKLAENPHVAAWWTRLSAREAWGKTIGR